MSLVGNDKIVKMQDSELLIYFLTILLWSSTWCACCLLFHAVYPNDTKADDLITYEFIRGGLLHEILCFPFNSTLLPHKSEEKCPPVQQAFKQYPAASKHTPTLHHTLLKPSCLPTVTHQLAQSDICYVPLLFLNPPAVSPLWLSTDMPHSDGLYRTQTISLCCPQKGKSGTQRSLYLYRIHAELSFVCKTPLSNHLNASSHSLPPTKSASFIL